MYLYKVEGVYLHTTPLRCTVEVMVTFWTFITTVTISAAEFGINTRGVIFPASGTIGVAFQPPN